MDTPHVCAYCGITDKQSRKEDRGRLAGLVQGTGNGHWWCMNEANCCTRRHNETYMRQLASVR